MKINVKLELNEAQAIDRVDSRCRKAQMFLDSEVLRCSAPFVPMRTGALMRSGTFGTKLGSGNVVYNAPYARRMYYGLNYNFSKNKHPQASAQWFEKAKAVHKNAWLEGVAKIIKE